MGVKEASLSFLTNEEEERVIEVCEVKNSFLFREDNKILPIIRSYKKILKKILTIGISLLVREDKKVRKGPIRKGC